jgi:hypothetical protein
VSGLLATVRSIPAALSGFGRRAAVGAVSQHRRRADARARAICPVDSWTFTPLHSNGRCPLCGWVPEGYVYAPPLLAPYSRYWGGLATIAATSLFMCIVVVVAYTQG